MYVILHNYFERIIKSGVSCFSLKIEQDLNKMTCNYLLLCTEKHDINRMWIAPLNNRFSKQNAINNC
jgi:hypothetical protein